MKHRHTWLYPSAGNRSACCLPSASSTAQAAITYRKLAARRAVPLLSIILALLLAISAALPVGAVNAPNGYVDDASGVIDSDTCEYIRSRSDALCKLTGAQIVIAITRSLNGEPIDRYAERYFLDREIGDKNKDNGVLLLMAIDDGNYWLTKGSGLESTLPVSSLRTMLDSIFEPCFAAGEYSVGTKALFDALYGKLCALYGVNPSPTSGSSAMISGSTDTQTEAQGSERGILPYMLLAIIAAAIVAVVIFLVRAMRTPAEDTGTENLDGSSIAPRDTSAAGTANFVGAAKSISQSAGAAERTDKRSVGAVGRGKENGNTRTVLVSDESTRRDSSPRSAFRASSALASLGSSASQAKASAAPAAASARTTAPAAEKQSQPPQWQRHKLRRSCSVYCSRADARAVPAMQGPLNRTEQHKADKYPHPISPFRAVRRPFSRHRPHGRDKRLAGFKIQLPYSVGPHARRPPRRDRRYGRDNPHSARRSPRGRLLITATETTARAEYAETTEEDKAVRREYALCLTICRSMRHALQSE